MTVVLPGNLLIRAPTLDDLEAVTALMNTCAIAEYSAPEYTTDDVRSDWEWHSFTLATDAWIIAAPDGKLVGYGAVWMVPVRLFGEAYVHPEQHSRGIGSCLLELIEARAKQHTEQAPTETPLPLLQEISATNQAGRQLLEQRGYSFTRYDWRMKIEFSEAPPVPEWPDGITVRAFVPGQDDRAVHATIEEAFQQNRGYTPTPFEHWAQTMIQRVWHDPTLWFLAMDGAEIAGVALCRKRQAQQAETGWVNILAVRLTWRKQGLGMALLRHAFGEFYRHGTRQVGLSVDSQNATGATRLYERAGMRVARQDDRYEKYTRPGYGYAVGQ